MAGSIFEKVYEVVKKIPSGKVSTYGLVAERLKKGGIKITPRIVGYALHANCTAQVPCHRVVDRTGRLAPGFAFDGPQEQKRRLVLEGVPFVDENHVDLEKCLIQESTF